MPTTLSEESGFDKLVAYYKKNQDRPWYDWLEVKTVFPRPGKQGLVGLMVAKDDPNLIFVFKVSQYINYLVQHELSVMKSLNTLANYCPHFCKSVGGILCEVDPTSRKEGNPFEMNSPYIVEKEVLLMEYLNKSYKFYNYIRSDRVKEEALYSTIKQTLLAIAIAQKTKRFAHYDLHSNNIMMKRCNRDLVFLYILDEENQFCVATNGCYPVIIDFGFSYIGDMDDGPLWPTLGHTEVGFMSSEFDSVADPKLFLVTASGEIHDKRHSKRSRKLSNITKNIYSNLNIDWESGWDQDAHKSASDYVIDALAKYNDESKLFKEFDHYCIDILQTLVILPLQKQPFENIKTAYVTFIHEFAKIEHEISTPFYCMYILKGLVDAARMVRADYRNVNTRNHAVDFFRQSLHEYINGVAKFCRPKDIHYERMLCSLLCLARCIEGVLYQHVHTRMKKKGKMYRKLPLKTVEQIVSVIDINIPDTYVFNADTTVMVMDCVRQTCSTFSLTEEERDEINETESISRGAELYQMLKSKK
uniref:Protein kinase domain-containing protein n=1 Tax=viral metagenome TaxID=1070528 RepID=A0A6C0EJN9_9ZZZZ